MASSSGDYPGPQDDDHQHDFAIASRRAKVRSARANRTVNAYIRGEEIEREADSSDIQISSQTKYEVLVEQNDASPKPISRILNKEKRCIPRGAHAAKNNKGVRDRRKLREKRRSTGVMHPVSTESTGNSTGEDENENNENANPTSVNSVTSTTTTTTTTTPVSTTKPVPIKPEEKVFVANKRKSDSDLDADDEANKSDVVSKDDEQVELKRENDRLVKLLETKDKRISALEIQVRQLSLKISELSQTLCTSANPTPAIISK